MDKKSGVSIPEKANLGSLPDKILLEIFGYLELKDRVRLSGVNKKFQELSELSIATTKSLVLDDHLIAYTNISGHSFMVLLESWAKTVRKIEATSPFSKCLLKAITETLFRNLRSVTLEIHYDSPWIRQYYADLVRRNPSIRSISLRIGMHLEFSQEVIYENLERLEFRVGNANDDQQNISTTLKSLTGRVPNLRTLFVCVRFDLSQRAVIEFLDSAQNLETVHIFEDMEMETFEKIVNLPSLWHLPNLKSLVLHSDRDVDDNSGGMAILTKLWKKLSIACPSLEAFAFYIRFEETTGKIDKTTMSEFKNLQTLRLPQATIGQQSILNIIDSCPRLSYLLLRDIKADTKMFTSIAAMIGCRKLTIAIHCRPSAAVIKAWEEAKDDTGLEIIWARLDESDDGSEDEEESLEDEEETSEDEISD